MGPMEWYDYMRFVTGLVAGLAMYKLALDGYRQWEIFTYRFKCIWWGTTGLLFYLLYESVELVFHDASFTSRQFLAFFVAAIMLIGARNKGPLIKEEATEQPY